MGKSFAQEEPVEQVRNRLKKSQVKKHQWKKIQVRNRMKNQVRRIHHIRRICLYAILWLWQRWKTQFRTSSNQLSWEEKVNGHRLLSFYSRKKRKQEQPSKPESFSGLPSSDLGDKSRISKALAFKKIRPWSPASLPLNSIGHIFSISCFARRKAPSKTELTHFASSSVYMGLAHSVLEHCISQLPEQRGLNLFYRWLGLTQDQRRGIFYLNKKVDEQFLSLTSLSFHTLDS